MKHKSQLRAFSGAYSGIDFTVGTEGAILAKSLANLSQVAESLSDNGQKAMISNMQCHWEVIHSMASKSEGSPIGITFGVLQTAGEVTTNQVQTVSLEETDVLDLLTDDVFGFQRISNPKFTSVFWRLDINDGEGDNYHYYKATGNVKIPQNVLALINKESETERLQDLYLVCYFNAFRGISSTIGGSLHAQFIVDYTLRRQTIKVR